MMEEREEMRGKLELLTIDLRHQEVEKTKAWEKVAVLNNKVFEMERREEGVVGGVSQAGQGCVGVKIGAGEAAGAADHGEESADDSSEGRAATADTETAGGEEPGAGHVEEPADDDHLLPDEALHPELPALDLEAGGLPGLGGAVEGTPPRWWTTG